MRYESSVRTFVTIGNLNGAKLRRIPFDVTRAAGKGGGSTALFRRVFSISAFSWQINFSRSLLSPEPEISP